MPADCHGTDPEGKTRRKKDRIPQAEKPAADETIRFCFKYSQYADTGKYTLNGREAAYFRALLERFQAVCCTTLSEFRRRSHTLRNHPVDFRSDNVSEEGFVCLNEALREQLDPQAFQFSVSANAHGRIVGALVDNTFHLIWYDVDHRLYPGA